MRRMDGYLGLCEWLEFLYIHILSTNVSLKDCKNGFFWVEGGKDHSHPPPKKRYGLRFYLQYPHSSPPIPISISKKNNAKHRFSSFLFLFLFLFFFAGGCCRPAIQYIQYMHAIHTSVVHSTKRVAAG